jgi:anti-sigma factor RsiW
MNEHEQTRKNLAALEAGLLTADEEAAARAHLAACPDCAREADVWRRLRAAVEGIPETLPAPARLHRLAALAQAHREGVLEKRWNRLVLTGLVLYGWALWIVVAPLLPVVIDWLAARLALPWPAVVVLGLAFWWSFCWVIGLALLPLLRQREAELEEKVL